MGLFNWLKRKKITPDHYIFSDDDSSLGVEVRKYKRELKKLKFEKDKIKAEMELEKTRAELELLRDELYGREEAQDPEETPEKMMMNMLMMQMIKKQGNGLGTMNDDAFSQPYQAENTKRAYSNHELKAMKDKLPKKALKQAQKMEAVALMPIVRENLPDADEESIARAVKILLE